MSEGVAIPALAAFATAAILALLLTPVVRRFARRFEVLDHPGERRVNTAPVPRGGGIAVAAAFVITTLGILAADSAFAIWPAGDAPTAREVIALAGGAVLAVVVGSLDDWFDLRARWQLVGQLVVAGVAVGLGITVNLIADPLGHGFIHLADPFGAAFAVVWILGMINSINFIDGLDGLSSGVALIAALTLGIISLTGPIDQPAIALFCFALAGALLGFLRWNLHPASIFVGTSGVMVIGYVLALLAILGSAKVAVALLVLGVPIIDTFWIIVRRLSEGRSPFSPDRGHIHHRLLDLGLSHLQTVLVIYAVCIALAVLSLVLSGTGQLYAFLGVFVIFGLGLYLLSRATGGDDAS